MLLVMTFAITSQFAMANAGYGFKQYLTVDDTYTLSSTGPIKHFIGYLVFNVFSNTSSSFHVSVKWTVGRTDTIDLIIHSIGCVDSMVRQHSNLFKPPRFIIVQSAANYYKVQIGSMRLIPCAAFRAETLVVRPTYFRSSAYNIVRSCYSWAIIHCFWTTALIMPMVLYVNCLTKISCCDLNGYWRNPFNA